MGYVVISVRISGDAIRTLSKLAAKLGQSKAQVIRQAPEEMDERVFWSEVNAAFARDADASGDRAEEQSGRRSEIHVWEQASATDFMDEKW